MFKAQNGNVTSGVMGVEWQAGYNGGYALVRFELQYKIATDNDYMDYDGMIHDLGDNMHSALIYSLKPSTGYNLYVRTINARPPSDGGNFSPWTHLTQSTTGKSDQKEIEIGSSD